MSITNLNILDQTVYGQASGNYDGSSQDFDSDGQKAVGYYQGQGGIQTVAISTTNFEGQIILQATIDQEWETAQWVDAYTYGDGEPITEYRPVTLIGNYTWMRAHVIDFVGGTINSVVISY